MADEPHDAASPTCPSRAVSLFARRADRRRHRSRGRHRAGDRGRLDAARLRPSTPGRAEYVAAVFYVVSLLTVLSISLRLQSVAGVAGEMDAAALRPCGDLSADRRHLHAFPRPTRRSCDCARRMLAVVWGAAAIGMAIKLFLPGRFDRLAVVFYLAIGWSGVADRARRCWKPCRATTLWLIVAGGIVYSCGVVFFVWQSLRFQTAVWHGFVVDGRRPAPCGRHGLSGHRPALIDPEVESGFARSWSNTRRAQCRFHRIDEFCASEVTV